MNHNEQFLRAISYAISEGHWVDVSRLDIDKSHVRNGEYFLRTSGSTIVSRIPLSKLFTSPIADIDLLKAKGPNRLRAEREICSSDSSPAVKAVAWATAMGYSVPSKIDDGLAAFLVVIGLFIFIIPGALILIWALIQINQYDNEMNKLIEKWVDAGRPKPGEGIKEVTHQESITERVDHIETPSSSTEQRLEELDDLKEKLQKHQLFSVENSATSSASTEQRLEELNSLKEKRLITDEEYKAMRKKALGL